MAGLLAVAPLLCGSFALAQTTTRPEGPVSSRACLPGEIRELVIRGGVRRQIDTCDLACLQRPSGLDADDLARLQRRHGIQWCRECIPLSSFLPITAIERIEQESHIGLEVSGMDPRKKDFFKYSLLRRKTDHLHEYSARHQE